MKKLLCGILAACAALSLTGCDSGGDSSLDDLIGSLDTTYLDGGQSDPEETYISSASGTVSSFSADGTFTLVLTGKTKMKFNFDDQLSVYGADSFGDGDSVTVSFTDSASADRKKALPAVAVTVITSTQTEASEETTTEVTTEETSLSAEDAAVSDDTSAEETTIADETIVADET